LKEFHNNFVRFLVRTYKRLKAFHQINLDSINTLTRKDEEKIQGSHDDLDSIAADRILLESFKQSCNDDLIHEIIPLLSEKEKEEIFQENDWELAVEIILRV